MKKKKLIQVALLIFLLLLAVYLVSLAIYYTSLDGKLRAPETSINYPAAESEEDDLFVPSFIPVQHFDKYVLEPYVDKSSEIEPTSYYNSDQNAYLNVHDFNLVYYNQSGQAEIITNSLRKKILSSLGADEQKKLKRFIPEIFSEAAIDQGRLYLSFTYGGGTDAPPNYLLYEYNFKTDQVSKLEISDWGLNPFWNTRLSPDGKRLAAAIYSNKYQYQQGDYKELAVFNFLSQEIEQYITLEPDQTFIDGYSNIGPRTLNMRWFNDTEFEYGVYQKQDPDPAAEMGILIETRTLKF